ncbi:MAG: Rho termination factor N-terminal domain-containing protein, partial [Candidatus Sericytochromatia bacterium]|nr:Rho termination factor N-terminal domain-containing protein [Candidatus Sericytochromatia bacterium]
MAEDKPKKIKSIDENNVSSVDNGKEVDLSKSSKIELNSLAKELKVKNYSKMNKAEIIEAIINYQKNPVQEEIKLEDDTIKDVTKKDQIPLVTNQGEKSNIEDLPKSQLNSLAKELKVKNYSRLNKYDLIKAINKSEIQEPLSVEKEDKTVLNLDSNKSSELDDMQMPELVELAKELKIKNYSRLNKSRLIKSINQAKKESNLVNPEKETLDINTEILVLDEIKEDNNHDSELLINDQADTIEKIGKKEISPYSELIKSKETVEKIISPEEKLRNEIIMQPSRFGFGKTNKEYLLDDEENISLPELSVLQDKIVLLPVDPFKTFAYWDLSQDTMLKLLELSLSELYLKVNDVTGIIYNGNNANFYWLEKCFVRSRDWYIYPQNSGRNLCVELGYILNGNFYNISTSNTIYVPPKQASSIVSDTFVIVNYPEPAEQIITPNKYKKRANKAKSPYYELNDRQLAENYNLKRLQQKMPVFNIAGEIPNYFVQEFEIVGYSNKVNNQQTQPSFNIPQKSTINPIVNTQNNNVVNREDNIITESASNIDVEKAVKLNNDPSQRTIISREYTVPESQSIIKLFSNLPATVTSFFEYIKGFDKKRIKFDNFYYEIPGESQKAIRLYYEWNEGEIPYRKEFFWFASTAPQIHENIYKVSWGPTWVKEFIGGSEQIRFIGASERFLGSSDIFLGGTERMIEAGGKFAGGSELFVGNNDKFMGGSEAFIGSSDKYLG